MIVAFPIGIYSAIRQDTIGDYHGRSFAILSIAVPGFWIGTLVFVLPSIWWGWSPSVEYIPITRDFGANIAQFIIPGVIMGTASAGGTMRMTRTMMLEVLRQDLVEEVPLVPEIFIDQRFRHSRRPGYLRSGYGIEIFFLQQGPQGIGDLEAARRKGF